MMNSETKVRVPWSDEKKARQRRYNKKSYDAHPERYKRAPKYCKVCDRSVVCSWFSKHQQTRKHLKRAMEQSDDNQTGVNPVNQAKQINKSDLPLDDV